MSWCVVRSVAGAVVWACVSRGLGQSAVSAVWVFASRCVFVSLCLGLAASVRVHVLRVSSRGCYRVVFPSVSPVQSDSDCYCHRLLLSLMYRC